MKSALLKNRMKYRYLLLPGIVCIAWALPLASDLPKQNILKQKTIHYHNLLEPDSTWLYVEPLFTHYIENQLYDSIWGIMKYHIRAASKSQSIEMGNRILQKYQAIFEECYSSDIYIKTLIEDEKGMIFLEEFRINEAEGIFLNSLKIRQKLLPPNDTLIAINHAYLAESYSYEGEYVKALEQIEKAIEIRLQTSAPDDRMLGVYYLMRAGTRFDKFDETEKDILNAIDILRKHHGNGFKGLNICYNNLANLYYDSGRTDDAIKTLMISVNNNEKDPRKNRRALAINYANLSRFYWGQGDREHGFYYCRRAIKLFEEKAESEKFYLYNLYDQIGGFYQAFEHYTEAMLYFEKSRKYKEELFGLESMPYAQYWYNMGRTLYYLNRPEEALERYTKSAALRKEILGDNSPLYADCLSDMAECYRMLGQYPKALSNFKQSSSIYKENYGMYHSYHIGDLANVADIYKLMGQTDLALSLYQECLSLTTQGRWKSESILENPPVELIKNNYSLNRIVINKHKILKEKGIQNRNIKYLIAALKTLDLSTSEQHKFYLELGGLQNRKDLVESISEIYRYKADLSFELFRMSADTVYLDDLFEYSENSKAFNLRDILRGDKAASFAGVPDSLVQEEKKLSNQIHLYLENEYDSENEETKEQFVEWQERLDEIKLIIKDSYPQYAGIRYDLQALTRQQAQQSLGQDESLVIIMKGVEYYYRLMLNKSDFEVFQLGHISMIEGCVDEMYQAMNDAQSQQFSESSNFLYKLIFGDIADQLNSTIFWIPDAYMHQLNPEILVKEVPKNSSGIDFSQLAYLLHDFEFIVNHSVVLTQEWYDYLDKDKAIYPMLGISPFSKAKSDEACVEKDRKLIRLPWSEKAIHELDNQYKGNFLVGQDATKSEVLTYLSKSNILHFGTHAITNNEEPLHSGLVLACDKDDPSWEARNLSAAELYGISLNAKLAVLTACQTGKGKFESGEGVISLARAFNFAGCPSLLMTLWSVDDRASSWIVLDFYQNLRQQLTISNSLHSAKKEYLRKHSGDLANPVYWGGMVMIGENQVVLMETKSSLFSYGPLIGIAVILVLLFLLFARKKMKQST
jgi:CHAT domain-containing protein